VLAVVVLCATPWRTRSGVLAGGTVVVAASTIVVGVVLAAVDLLTLGLWVGAAALAVVVVVAFVGFWLERDRGLHDALRFKPVVVGELHAILCGVDKTAP
jgi:hypothetical protein